MRIHCGPGLLQIRSTILSPEVLATTIASWSPSWDGADDDSYLQNNTKLAIPYDSRTALVGADYNASRSSIIRIANYNVQVAGRHASTSRTPICKPARTSP